MPNELAANALVVGDFPQWMIWGPAFLFGALWGSFFNVAIYRWPKEMSVVSPASHCPSCGAPVPWYRNVPLWAYLSQRGRAACCGAKMTPRYFLVELLSGVLCLALFHRGVVLADPTAAISPLLIESLLLFFFVGGLIIATFTDLEWMMIPDEVSLGGAALGLATVSFRSFPDPVDAAVGAGVGFLSIQLLAVYFYERLTGRRGMGEGDSKLLLFIGAFLGWKGVLFSILAGSVQGVFVAILGMVTGSRVGPPDDLSYDPGPFNEEGAPESRCEDREGDIAALRQVSEQEDPSEEAGAEEEELEEFDGAPMKLPFGPFLALGALEFLFFGPQIIEWYLGLL